MDVGDIVEDFVLADDEGVERSLSGLLEGGPVVLFFYPAALSPGCTMEACHFRDMAGELRAAGGQPVGISGDAIERQAEFSSKHSLGYPLLSDADGKVRATFGINRSFGLPRRMTFVIDTDRRVLAVVKSEIRMSVHADKALAALQQRARG
ncbi:peroxiredoxin [Dactylosporangium darangshiense]|uniref:thioredoxin-dependent peroxiredoxin n=1 Tax=Dactylosporangium darangshiense TaxID=579108 RepID=A0ABP8DJ91_9ACTN